MRHPRDMQLAMGFPCAHASTITPAAPFARSSSRGPVADGIAAATRRPSLEPEQLRPEHPCALHRGSRTWNLKEETR